MANYAAKKKTKADFIAEIQFSPLHAKDAGKKRQVEWLHHFEPLPAMFKPGTRIRRRRIGLIWISKGAERRSFETSGLVA